MHWKNLYHATCSGPLITKGVFIKGILGAGGGNADAMRFKENRIRFEIQLQISDHLLQSAVSAAGPRLIAQSFAASGPSAIRFLLLLPAFPDLLPTSLQQLPTFVKLQPTFPDLLPTIKIRLSFTACCKPNHHPAYYFPQTQKRHIA
ncbi:hypothetical protein [Metabacillus indicus]|uniref:hypothetical protein n=1 Tax=Metabacillus indicus TaxID=246786 RepID=UPI002492582F|nr:hypothetical protein [Metabacillus indicus]